MWVSFQGWCGGHVFGILRYLFCSSYRTGTDVSSRSFSFDRKTWTGENGSIVLLTGQSTSLPGSGWTRVWIVRGWGYPELSEVIRCVRNLVRYVRNLETLCNDINFIADSWRQVRNCTIIYALSCSWQQLKICSALNSFNSVLITSIHGKKQERFSTLASVWDT